MFYHRMKIALLSLGMVGGFAMGATSLHCRMHRRAAFERHVAQVCVEAARAEGRAEGRADPRQWPGPPPGGPHGYGYAPRW